MSDYASPGPRSKNITSSSAAARVAARRKRRRRHPVRIFFEWFTLLLLLAALAIGGVVLALLFGERDFYGRIYPHISVRGVGLGGQSLTGAHSRLEWHYSGFLSNPVEIRYGTQVWRPTAAELGISLDTAGAVSAAAAVGRTAETRADNARTVAAVWEHGVELPLTVRIDQQVMQAYLLEVARSVEQAPRDADVALEGATIVVTPEGFGMQVLVDETLRDMTAAAQTLTAQQITLRTRELAPRVRDTDTAPVVAELQQLLAGPITLADGDARWDWDVERIAEWIDLRRAFDASGRPTVTVQIDQNQIRSELLPIAAAVRQDGALPRVEWNGGALQIIEPGTEGRGLDANLALARINEALAGGPRELALPYVALPPPVTEANLASLGINGLLAEGASSFRASQQYRVTNIRAGARRMHGLLIPPGATFSFNDNLGAVDASNGFVEGLAIVDNRTQKEWGGGLCQVSTTVFRAAFWAGLPIAERHEHAFRISWYEELGEPPGLDAAIFTPYNDLRFVNDTGGWLLLQSGIDLDRQRLYMALYGPASADREVAMDYRVLSRTAAPRQPVYIDDPSYPRGYFRRSDTARGGMTVEVYRTVRANGVVLANDTFFTKFEPWPNIYVRGTGR